MTGSLYSTRPPTLTHTPLSLLDAEIRLNHYVLPSTPLCLYSGFCFSPVCLPLCPFFLSFYSDTLLCGRLKQCRMPLYRSITASSLFLDIYLCLVFFFPGIPLLLLPLSLLLLLLPPPFSLISKPFSPFIALPPSCLHLPHLHLTPSPTLFLHYCFSILNRTSLITFLPEKRWRPK